MQTHKYASSWYMSKHSFIPHSNFCNPSSPIRLAHTGESVQTLWQPSAGSFDRGRKAPEATQRSTGCQLKTESEPGYRAFDWKQDCLFTVLPNCFGLVELYLKKIEKNHEHTVVCTGCKTLCPKWRSVQRGSACHKENMRRAKGCFHTGNPQDS